MFILAFKLIIGHAIADFVFQPLPMALGKCRTRKPRNEEEATYPSWPYWLTSHALVHGGIVWLITGNVYLGLLETVLHWFIDLAKCEKRIGMHQDQFAHLFTKLLYIFLLYI